MRDSDLIRKLLKSGLTYRAISIIAKCSHGSVHQEKLSVKREEEAQAQETLKAQELTVVFPDVSETEVPPQI